MKWAEMTRYERDFLVADKVLGLNRAEFHWMWPATCNFTQNISDAWAVVEKLKISIVPQAGEPPEEMKYLAFIDNDPFSTNVEAFAETAAEAICIAALKAVGVEFEDN